MGPVRSSTAEGQIEKPWSVVKTGEVTEQQEGTCRDKRENVSLNSTIPTQGTTL